MILYDPQHQFTLLEFGIQIPVMNSRASRTFQNLTSHPLLGPRITDWHQHRDGNHLSIEDLERVHDPAYVRKLFSPGLEEEIMKTFELVDSRGSYNRYDPRQATRPLTELFDRILDRASGTVQCCRAALEKNFCFYFGGGMHHAQKNFGKGFCIVNDVVLAVRKLQAENSIRSAWIIDIDAHKGDGTAALTQGDDTVVTLSAHMATGWPLDGPSHDEHGRLNPSFIPSDIDIPVAAGQEHLYVKKLADGLRQLESYPRADIAVVLSGSDPYEKDALPSTAPLRLSLEQLFERDRLVYRFLKERRIPRAYLMAGGYGDYSWQVYTQFLQWALVDHMGLQ
ncbi:MAG: histone deacetylase [Deltaproteobacteria bacterium SG8_13]|nr:MAG: histone deacetylase [Deltaproteobacteria bacterium SG8_13]